MPRFALALAYFWTLACPSAFAEDRPQPDPQLVAAMNKGAASLPGLEASGSPDAALVRRFLKDYSAPGAGDTGTLVKEFDAVAARLGPDVEGLRPRYFPGRGGASAAAAPARSRLDAEKTGATVAQRGNELKAAFQTRSSGSLDPPAVAAAASLGTFQRPAYAAKEPPARIVPASFHIIPVPDAPAAEPDRTTDRDGQGGTGKFLGNVGVGSMVGGGLLVVGLATGVVEVTVTAGIAAAALVGLGYGVWKISKSLGGKADKLTSTLSRA